MADDLSDGYQLGLYSNWLSLDTTPTWLDLSLDALHRRIHCAKEEGLCNYRLFV